ncbi:MAG: hypothetical protein R3336_07265 [Phycisphaeraceae bacterium]|nr:hypothetical protein [Phycisphaeraceae bacterium]
MMALGAALMLSGGCNVLTPVTAPTARVVSVEITERSDEGTRVEATVELTNPNDVPLPLPDSYYRLSVAGAGTYVGRQLPLATLPPKGVQRVKLPAAYPVALGKVLSGYQLTGEIVYRPPGEIRALLTESNVPLPRVAIRSSWKASGR